MRLHQLLLCTLPALIVLLLFSCGKREDTTDSKKDIQPVFKGSDTEFEMISEINNQFEQRFNHSQKFQVKGGGSKTGIEAFINQKVLVANASRKMTEDELDLARKNGLDPIEVIIAMDAIAIITHPTASIDSLSVYELRKIYQGEITNWQEVGGPDKAIHLYGRDSHSGTHDYMLRKVFLNSKEGNIKEMATTDEVLQAVKNDPNGIGYVGIGSLIEKNGKPRSDVWATYMYIDGGEAHSPHEKYSIKNGEYPLIRPLFQYYDGIPQGTLRKFLDFTLSEQGQKIVTEHGYFPINDFHRQLNAYNGINSKFQAEK